MLVMLVMTALAAGCSTGTDDPATHPAATAGRSGTTASATSGATSTQPTVMTTEVGIGHVAGRLGTDRRKAVKAAVSTVVDRYLDAAFVAGPWPRSDFSAAFADFRRGAAKDAAGRDLDLVTNHDLGPGLSAVTATKRRVRLDVLAPRGRAGAATAGFVVALDLVPTGRQRIAGHLYLTREHGAWKVFGYEVRKEAAS